ncbi:hypothetical protein [Rhodopseudomonas sp.]|uniref:hypothetical protein n=1 Tax=Rhodopseudomonas sp. TaxID=1078 RepID=UPI003B3AC1B4
MAADAMIGGLTNPCMRLRFDCFARPNDAAPQLETLLRDFVAVMCWNDVPPGTFLRNTREGIMAELKVSDEAVAVLVDIARTAGRDLNAGQRLELDHLISQGLAAVADSDQGRSYTVTDRGQKLLDERGVGANEA